MSLLVCSFKQVIEVLHSLRLSLLWGFINLCLFGVRIGLFLRKAHLPSEAALIL